MLCLNEFGIVLFTGAKGVTTLPMLVYGKAILESDYPGACVVAVVNVLVSVGLYGLYRVVSRRGWCIAAPGSGPCGALPPPLPPPVRPPLFVILAASFAGHWSGVLPSDFTAAHYTAATRGESLQALITSLVTAVTASLLALAVGTWGALGAHALPRPLRRVLDALFVLPVAVPSVVVGLAVLVAFSQPPVLLNGTRWIVILAHTVLVTAFAYQSVSAAVLRLDPATSRPRPRSAPGPHTSCGGYGCHCCCRPSRPPRASASPCPWAS